MAHRQRGRELTIAQIEDVRPGAAVNTTYWLEIEADPPFLEVMRGLLKRRYEKPRHWVTRSLAALVVVLWIVGERYSAIVAVLTTLLVALLILRRLFGRVRRLHSLVIFYPDKAIILEDVRHDSRQRHWKYATRRDVTPGSVTKAFSFEGLNPFWRLHNMKLRIRGQRFVVSRMHGFWSIVDQRHRRALTPDSEVTFFELKRRLRAYSNQ